MAWHRAIEEAALAEGACRRVEFAGRQILLSRSAGRVFASAAQCPHLGLDLEKTGEVDEGSIRCRAHGYRMDLSSGACASEPGVSFPVYETEAKDGWVWVRLAP